MKNEIAKIEQIKSLKSWSSTRFHGNKKMVGNLSVSELKEIVAKKYNRSIGNYIAKNGKVIYSFNFKSVQKSNVQIVRELIEWSLECKNTNYFKVMIEGNSGIYYASPAYGHSDYNKTRLFDKNKKTLKLMSLFNSIINK